MKKILVVVFLLQNWSVFAQTQVKLNMGALISPRLDVSLEHRIRHFSLEVTAEYSKPELIIGSNTNSFTNYSYKGRIGYGGDIRCYADSKNENLSYFIGPIVRFNKQEFDVEKITFQRKERFIGFLSGVKRKFGKHILVETSFALSFLSEIKFKDITKNIDIEETSYPSWGTLISIKPDPYWTDKSTFKFLGNLAIIYQF